ncbi:MAG: hypothetical protein ACR2N2_10880 [Acidimicrobiia bacterium]
MAQIQDIPRLFAEFVALAREYLIQETIEPAKKLGWFAGHSLGATILWSMALVLLAVAGLRAFFSILPDGAYWEAFAYVVVAVVVLGFLALVVKLVPSRGVHDGVPSKSHGDESV